jgi:hypothetical protein
MKIKAFIALLILLLIYFGSYIFVRQSYVEVLNHYEDKEVIFPDDKVYLYYFYRPLSYIDGAITDMKFHIGQHG